MKKILTLSLFILFCLSTSYAQIVSVVSPSNTTKVYDNVITALNEAENGSTVYIGGGTYKLAEGDYNLGEGEYILEKRLNIIGVGYRDDTNPVTGSTNLDGSFVFAPGSDGSSLTGAYLTGSVTFGKGRGENEYKVNNILVQQCNVYNVNTRTPSTNLDDEKAYNGDNLFFSQNILRGNIIEIRAKKAVIVNNFFTHTSDEARLRNMAQSTIKNNVFFGGQPFSGRVETNKFDNNICLKGWAGLFNFLSFQKNVICNTDGANYPGNYSGMNKSTVFKSWGDKINFSYTDNYQMQNVRLGTDGKEAGVYGGDGFIEGGIPVNPHFDSVDISTKTNSDGTLNVKIKASVR